MREINLSQGQKSIVDDCDYDYLLSLGSFHADYKKHADCFYGQICLNGQNIRLHKLIAECMFGPLSADIEVDHINRDTLDNRRSNIRLCERWQNCHNRKSRSDKKAALPKGVFKYGKTGKFYAELVVKGVRYRTKGLSTPELADTAYHSMVAEHVGQYGCFEK